MADLSQLPNFFKVADPNAPEVAAFLANLRQYDPAASYVARQDMLGGEDAKLGEPYYKLNVNPSLLPAMPLGGAGQSAYTATNVPGATGYEWSGPNWAGVQPDGPFQYRDPGAIYQDPYYGNWTSRSNIAPQKADWLDYVGPLAVGAFGFGIPALAGAMSGGAIGGAFGSAGSLPWWAKTGQALTRQVGSGSFDPYGTAAALAPAVASLAPVPVDNWDRLGDMTKYGLPPATEISWGDVAKGISTGATAGQLYNKYKQMQRPQPTQTQMSYAPQNYGKLNQSLVNSDNQPVATNYADDPYGYRGSL